jgi:aspartyl-tRNA(Asn)/glutamyl-tRNA(Gln) amidotransferase subunit A
MDHLSAQEISDLFKKGEASAVSIAESVLKRVDEHDPHLKAFLSVYSERLMDKAKALDTKRSQGKTLGKLAAVPIAIKDNIHVKDEITTCGSLFLSNYRAPFTSTAIRLLEEEDGLIVGKTNLDEFAMGSSTENSAYQKTKNPWDLHCSPGGSSGGSAAAVAARLCPIALGSDTGGSIRQPASFCGIVGFKPTYGRVSRYGLVAFGSSLDQIGPFARNVSDAALVLEVMGRCCSHDSTSLQLPQEAYRDKLSLSLKGAKIGVPWKFLEGLSEEARQNFMESLELFKKMGVSVVDVDLDILNYSVAVYYILATAEASTNLARFDGIRYGRRSSKAKTLDEVYYLSKQEGFGPEVKKRIILGTYVLSAGYQDAYYKKAQKVRTLIIEQYKKAFSQCNVIATPTSPASAFKLGEMSHDPLQMYLQDIYTIPANLAGIPAISIPSGFCHDNKPLGFQIVGPQMHDAEVLRFAHHFEKATDFHTKAPPL